MDQNWSKLDLKPLWEQYCLWRSEEHIVGDLSPPVPGNLHRDKLNKGLSRHTQSFVQLVSIYVPWDRGLYITNNVLLAAPEAVLCHNEVSS